MAIQLHFDHNNIKQPTFILCKQNGERIGLIYPQSVTFLDKFNSYAEISFYVNKVENTLFDEITNLRLIWCKEWDKYFTMSVDVDEADSLSKSVTAQSLGEAELSQIKIYNMGINTDTAQGSENGAVTTFYSPAHINTSLLHKVLKNAPQFEIGHIDTSLYDLVRSFSFNSISIYDILIQLGKEFNCIFQIENGTNNDGTIRRVINCYDLESHCLDCGNRCGTSIVCPKCNSTNINQGYGEDTTVFISTDNLAKEVKFTTNTSNIRNCFKVSGGDDNINAALSDININGSDKVYYLNGDVIKDMSEGLKTRLAEYQEQISYCKNNFGFTINDRNLITDYNMIVDRYSEDNEDLVYIPASITGYSDILTNYINVINLKQYINDMPYTKATTTAKAEAQKIDFLQFDYNRSATTTQTQINNALTTYLCTFVENDYDVTIRHSNVIDNSYYIQIRVTNKNNDTDYADRAMLVTIISDYQKQLQQKINSAISGYKSDVGNLVSLYNGSLATYSAALDKQGLNNLMIYKDIAQSILDILIEEGQSDKKADYYDSMYVPYYNKLVSTNIAIQQRTSELTTVNTVLGIIATHKREIQTALDFDTYFADHKTELAIFLRNDEYKNDAFKSDGLLNAQIYNKAAELLEVAEKEIYKSATLQHSIEATLQNLLVMPDFAPIVDRFAVGNWIRIKCDKDVYRLRLLQYQINFDNLENFPIVFSDVVQSYDGMSDLQSVVDSAKSMSSTYSATMYQAKQGQKSYRWFDKWFSDGLSLTNASLKNSDNQEFIIDNHGLLCRHYNEYTKTYSPEQLKIVNSTMAITNDDWASTKTAVGRFTFKNPETGETYQAYGINGEVIIGSIILGEQLGIYSDDNKMTFDGNGLTITNDTNTVTINPSAENLMQISKGEDNIFYLDSNGVLHIEGDGTGIDLTANESVTTLQGDLQTAVTTLSSNITQTAQQIKTTISAATNKYTTGNYNISLYGYGAPTYDAADYSGAYYLDQTNGNLYLSNGDTWSIADTLTLISESLQSQITQNAGDIALRVIKGDRTINAGTASEETVNDTISEIIASTKAITLNTTGKLLISSGNFQLDSRGTATMRNAILTGGILESSNYVNPDNEYDESAYDGIMDIAHIYGNPETLGLNAAQCMGKGYLDLETGKLYRVSMIATSENGGQAVITYEWSLLDTLTLIRAGNSGTPAGGRIDLNNGTVDFVNFDIASNGDVSLNNATLEGGVIKSANYSNYYSSGVENAYSGMKINLSNGSVISPNFKLSSSGIITASDVNLTGGLIKSTGYSANTEGCKIDLSDGSIDFKNFKLDTYGNLTLSGGVIKSANYVANSSGTKIDLSDGSIDSKNFSITSTGILNATGANISGTVTTTDGDYKTVLSSGQLKCYYNNSHTGNVGGSHWTNDSTKRGMAFQLDASGYYMAWSAKDTSNDSQYTTIMTYVRGQIGSSFTEGEGLYISEKLIVNASTKLQSVSATSLSLSSTFNANGGINCNSTLEIGASGDIKLTAGSGYSIHTYGKILMHTDTLGFTTAYDENNYISAMTFDRSNNKLTVGTSGKALYLTGSTVYINGVAYSNSVSGLSTSSSSVYVGDSNKNLYFDAENIEIRSDPYHYYFKVATVSQFNYPIYVSGEYSDIMFQTNNIGLGWNNSIGVRYCDSSSGLSSGFYVGIDGTTLYLRGSSFYAGGSTISTTSDVRKKNTIQPLANKYINLAKALRPVSFKYNDDIALSGRTHTGFIAQDVLQAMTDCGIDTTEFAAFVDIDKDGKEYALRYEEFIALILGYVQELDNKNQMLESEVQTLTSRVQMLENA